MGRGMGWVIGVGAIAVAMGGQPGLAQDQQGASGRLQGLAISGNDPIQIESDRLEVVEADNKAVFSGNVTVTQGPTVMRAGSMTVFYAGQPGQAATGSSKIDRLEVDGKVYIKSDTQIATGDRGTFDMASEVLVLSGKKVVLSEGENVLVGCKLTVAMKTGRAQVDGCSSGGGSGRVQMSITPGSQNR